MTEFRLPDNAIGLSNAQATELAVWLEPWVDELFLSPRATLVLVTEAVEAEGLPELEFAEECLVVWGVAGTRLHVLIDDVKQDTFSGIQTAPAAIPGKGTKETIQIMFGGFLEARPGGMSDFGVKPKRGPLARLVSRFTRR